MTDEEWNMSFPVAMLLPNTSSPELHRQTRPAVAHWPQAEGGVGVLRTDHLERESLELFLPGGEGGGESPRNLLPSGPLSCQETNTWSLIADPWKDQPPSSLLLSALPGLFVYSIVLFHSNFRIPFPLKKHLVGFVIGKAVNTEISVGRNDRCSYWIFSFKSRFYYNAKYVFLTSLPFTH